MRILTNEERYIRSRLISSLCTHLEFPSYDFVCDFMSDKNTVSHVWLTKQADGVQKNRVSRAALEPKLARE
jgi:hypothetical protein